MDTIEKIFMLVALNWKNREIGKQGNKENTRAIAGNYGQQQVKRQKAKNQREKS